LILDKIYYEFFALSVLKDYDKKRFQNIKHGDAPDLRVRKDIGIEVTQLGTEQEFRFLNIMNRIENGKKITEVDKITLASCGYEIRDQMLFCVAPQDEENVYRTIDSKISKLNKGGYNGYKMHSLFMFMSETLEHISVNDIINIFRKNKSENIHYDEIYILLSTDLFVYNTNTNRIDIKDICCEMRKHRNFAINKQKDYLERKNRKNMRKYIGDLHFGHANMNDKMDKRGFSTVEEMTEYMIKKWNSGVRKNDEVIIVGDFSFLDGIETNKILRRLNGKKFLIEGNHDYKFLKDKNFDQNLITWVKPYAELNDNNRKVICSHYPIMFYNGQYRKMEDGSPRSYMLYGHVHNTQDYQLLQQMLNLAEETQFYSEYNKEYYNVPFHMINCFCMFSDYVPLTLDEWIELDKKQK